jgi:hypothetical protein
LRLARATAAGFFLWAKASSVATLATGGQAGGS